MHDRLLGLLFDLLLDPLSLAKRSLGGIDRRLNPRVVLLVLVAAIALAGVSVWAISGEPFPAGVLLGAAWATLAAMPAGKQVTVFAALGVAMAALAAVWALNVCAGHGQASVAVRVVQGILLLLFLGAVALIRNVGTSTSGP